MSKTNEALEVANIIQRVLPQLDRLKGYLITVKSFDDYTSFISVQLRVEKPEEVPDEPT